MSDWQLLVAGGDGGVASKLHNQQCQPPSTLIDVPDMYDASSLNKNANSVATSSGLPILMSAMSWLVSASNWASLPASLATLAASLNMGVSMRPLRWVISICNNWQDDCIVASTRIVAVTKTTGEQDGEIDE